MRCLASLFLLLSLQCWAGQVDSSKTSPIVRGWSVVFEDTFSRPDTTQPESIGNGWIDASKSWQISNSTLVPMVTGTACGGRGATGPVRPKAENALNQGAELTTRPLISSDSITNVPYTLLLRIVPGSAWGTCYAVQLRFNPKAQNAMVVMGPGSSGGTFNGIKGESFPVLSGHSYIFTAAARTLYLGGFTLLDYTVADASAPETILSSGQSSVAPMKAAFCANPGAVGIQQERCDITRSDLNVITRFRSFVKPPGHLHCVTTSLAVSSTGHIVTLSGSGTAWNSNTPRFGLSGVPGCAIASQQVLSPTLARITINTGAATGLLSLSDPSVPGEDCKIEVVTKVPPLTVANLIPQPDSATTVRILGGVVTGGKPPYGYQWHRSTKWTFTPDDSTKIPNATQIDLTDTPPDDQCYAYKLVVTDSVQLSGTSPAAPGMLNYVASSDPVIKIAPDKIPALRIGWMGDSITASTGIPAKTIALLQKAGIVVASSTNCAVPGSQSSRDTKGWHPDATPAKPETPNYFQKALTAFHADNVNLIMVMLGTNEARGLAYIDAYKENMDAILTRLEKEFPGVPVVLNTPALATLENGGRDANEAHIAFVYALDQVVAEHPNAVRGDRNMPIWSYGRYHEYNDDIHPNTAGCDSYARYWANALLRYEQSVHP